MNTLEALLHICIYIYTHVYSTEMTHTSFLCACWKTGSAVTYKQHHTHVNTWMFENMQKFTVFAILPEGFVQSGKIVYRSSVCVCVCGHGKLWTRPGSNIRCKYILFFKLHGATEWVELTESWRCRWCLQSRQLTRKWHSDIFPRLCELFCRSFCRLNVAHPTRPSHEGFITCWKAFGYLTRVGLLAQKSAKSNNTCLTFYCVKYFYLSLRCLWRIVGADCVWTFCRAGRQTSKTASKQLNIITSCLCCHSARMETK